MKHALTKAKEKTINPFVIKSPLYEHINKHMIQLVRLTLSTIWWFHGNKCGLVMSIVVYRKPRIWCSNVTFSIYNMTCMLLTHMPTWRLLDFVENTCKLMSAQFMDDNFQTGLQNTLTFVYGVLWALRWYLITSFAGTGYYACRPRYPLFLLIIL